MFTISKDHMDETRLDLGTNTGEVSDATQRLNVQSAGRPQRPKSTGPRPSSADRRKATAETLQFL